MTICVDFLQQYCWRGPCLSFILSTEKALVFYEVWKPKLISNTESCHHFLSFNLSLLRNCWNPSFMDQSHTKVDIPSFKPVFLWVYNMKKMDPDTEYSHCFQSLFWSICLFEIWTLTGTSFHPFWCWFTAVFGIIFLSRLSLQISVRTFSSNTRLARYDFVCFRWKMAARGKCRPTIA